MDKIKKTSLTEYLVGFLMMLPVIALVVGLIAVIIIYR